MRRTAKNVNRKVKLSPAENKNAAVERRKKRVNA